MCCVAVLCCAVLSSVYCVVCTVRRVQFKLNSNTFSLQHLNCSPLSGAQCLPEWCWRFLPWKFHIIGFVIVFFLRWLKRLIRHYQRQSDFEYSHLSGHHCAVCQLIFPIRYELFMLSKHIVHRTSPIVNYVLESSFISRSIYARSILLHFRLQSNCSKLNIYSPHPVPIRLTDISAFHSQRMASYLSFHAWNVVRSQMYVQLSTFYAAVHWRTGDTFGWNIFNSNGARILYSLNQECLLSWNLEWEECLSYSFVSGPFWTWTWTRKERRRKTYNKRNAYFDIIFTVVGVGRCRYRILCGWVDVPCQWWIVNVLHFPLNRNGW